MSQVLTNLLVNALEHGSERAGVVVTVQGTDDEVTIAVHNSGPAIPEYELDGIFNAMKQRTVVQGSNNPARLECAGQCEREGRTAPNSAIDRNGPAVRLDDSLGDGEPQAQAARVRFVGLPELTKNVRQLIG